MAGGAVAVTDPGVQAPEQAPAPEAQGAPSTPAEGVSERGGAEGAAPGQQPGQAAPSMPTEERNPEVPWGRFREVQTAHTRLKHEYGQAREQWTQREQQLLEQAETQQREYGQIRQDYELISDLLRRNPDLAEQLYSRIGQGGGTPPIPAGPGGQPQQQPYTRLDPKQEQLLRQATDLLQQQSQATQQAQHRAEMERADQDLSKQVSSLLAQRGYSDAWLSSAKAHILNRARQMGDAQMEDIPYLFQEWFRDTHRLVQAEVNRIVSGKVQDTTLPATPPAGTATAPVRPTPSVGANGDDTAKALATALRGIGWT